MCQYIYSDSATNFVVANRKLAELKELWISKKHKEKVQAFFSENARNAILLCYAIITWNLILPRSSNIGGLWEAAVKSVKQHLNRTIAGTKRGISELAVSRTFVELSK